MGKKDDIVKEFSMLKGLGKAKAVLLYENGFDSLDKLKNATVEDLVKVKGINKVLAQSVKEQLEKKTGETEEKKKKDVVTAKKNKEENIVSTEEAKKRTTEAAKEVKEEREVEIVEEKGYKTKLKPKLDDDLKQMMSLRMRIDRRRPRFLREEWFRYKRVPRNWRRPDGLTSKMRMNLKYRPSKVRVGFRGPRVVRDLHSSGFEEIMVYNVDDISGINPEKQAARIGATVGMKKRVIIEQKADELGVRVLNRNQEMRK